MPTSEQVHRAQEAKRLTGEPLLVGALANIRVEAMTALMAVSPTDVEAIRSLQAVCKVTIELPLQLEGMIATGGLLEAEQTEQQPG